VQFMGSESLASTVNNNSWSTDRCWL